MKIHAFTWSLIFFAVTASLGLYMLSRYFRGLGRQNAVMILHGMGAAVGIAILFYYSAFELNTEVPYPSIFFFIVAVFGGLFMAVWDKVMNRKMPKYFPLFHAGAALAGFVTLAVYVFTHT